MLDLVSSTILSHQHAHLHFFSRACSQEPTRVDLPMSLTLILLDEPTDAWTALFTTNAFPGAPVKVGRKRLAEGGPLQAIVVNNKISNVCPGGEPG